LAASIDRRAAAVAGAAFAATLAWRLLTFTGFTNDHYAHLALAQQMLLGDRPVRDFSDPGWPLTYAISAAAWRIAGNAMWVEWLVTAVAFAFGAAFTVVAAQRLSGSTAIALLVAACEIVLTPRSYAYPKILPYAAFAWIVAAVGAPSTRRLVLLGLLIAIAFLLRHDHGVWIGTGTAAYLALAGRGDSARALMRRAAVVAGTTTAVLLPWLLFVAANGGIVPYFAGALEFARAEANASTLDAWPRFGAGANADAWLFWLFWSLPAAATVLILYRRRHSEERWPGELAAVGALVVLAVGVNAGFLRDLLRVRFADAVVPAALLGAWLLGAAFTTPWRRRAGQRAAQIAAVFVFAITVAAVDSATDLRDHLERTNVSTGLTGIYRRSVEVAGILRMPHRQTRVAPSRVSTTLMPFFDYLDRCTSAADRLIVTGENPDIVVLAGRGFAGDGVVFGAWYSSAANQDRTLLRLRDRPALFVILLDEPSFRQRFPVIAQYVEEEYYPFATLETPGIQVPILVDERRAPSGRDAATGWRCYR
jgi:hypothetical protein